MKRPAPRFSVAIGLLACTVGVARLSAQTPAIQSPHAVFAGSEDEEYLRSLQVAGEAGAYPWSIRAFSPGEVGRLLPDRARPHAWSGRYRFLPEAGRGLRLEPLPVRARVIYNSAYPYGSNDGPLWAGRGITTAVEAGIAVRYGPASLVLAPMIFRAENASFQLEPVTTFAGISPYSDWMEPLAIDLPQRFGSGPYTRIDPGQSTLRVDLPVVAFGVSTANQYWGPASRHPMVLGNNAPGFPQLFLGTSRPQDVWVGKVHGRVLWGRLDQSEYSSVPDSMSVRFATGMIAVFQPRGIPGLEVGASRFFHNVWPEGGLRASDFAQPFESVLKIGLNVKEEKPDSANDEVRKSSPDNQLASVFARWAFPSSGFEVYAEYGKEDHNYDFRDLVLELAHNAGYMVGIRKAWTPATDRLVALRAEVMNTQVSHTSLSRSIPQAPFYRHSLTRQGHTQLGQVLGSPAAYGGAGSVFGVDYYHPRGRWSVEWTRAINAERGRFTLEGDDYGEKVIDVTHGVSVEGQIFSRGVDLTLGMTGVYEFSRGFREDAANLNTTIGIRKAF